MHILKCHLTCYHISVCQNQPSNSKQPKWFVSDSANKFWGNNNGSEDPVIKAELICSELNCTSGTEGHYDAAGMNWLSIRPAQCYHFSLLSFKFLLRIFAFLVWSWTPAVICIIVGWTSLRNCHTWWQLGCSPDKWQRIYCVSSRFISPSITAIHCSYLLL